jgi:hypothetical protein
MSFSFLQLKKSSLPQIEERQKQNNRFCGNFKFSEFRLIFLKQVFEMHEAFKKQHNDIEQLLELLKDQKK